MTSTANEPDQARSQAVDWLMQVQSSPEDAAVQAGLDRWLAEDEAHRRAYANVLRMWRVAGGLTDGDATHGLPAAHQARRRMPARRGSTRLRLAAVAAAAIAACLLLAFLPSIQLRLEADHLTGTAELRSLVLEDGSKVELDARSAIAVEYDAGRREVALLAGQAFFEVVSNPGRPFIVRAGDVRVVVTGTSFAVRAWADAVSIAVQSGVVEVAVDGSSEPAHLLARGQRLDVDRVDGKVARREVLPDDVASWRQRHLVVDGATLGDVIEELGRHYAGAIVMRSQALAERRVTGVFDLRNPIDALEAIVRTQRGSIIRVTPYLTVVSAP